MSSNIKLQLENMPIVDGQGNIYVLSVFSDAVYKYSSNGDYVMSFGQGGGEPDDLDNVDAFAVDRMGNVYISECNQIHFFLPDGRFVRRFDAASLSVEENEPLEAWGRGEESILNPGTLATGFWANRSLVA